MPLDAEGLVLTSDRFGSLVRDAEQLFDPASPPTSARC
jgi:hypothetical protein